MIYRSFWASSLVGLSAAMASAHDYRAGGLIVDHPYAFATPATARAAAGYLTVRNEGDAPDALIGVRVEGLDAMLHSTEVDGQGVARMSHVERIEVPAGGEVALAPQGLHVMFTGLAAPFEDGDRVPAILVFETVGEIAVEFAIEARGAEAGSAPHDH